jgi:hypothetical protein
MIEGFDADVSLDFGVRQVSDLLLPLIRANAKRKEGVPRDAQLQLYLPGGIPFSGRSLRDFFTVPTFSRSQRFIYAVITRQIPDAVLTGGIDEVCDASTESRRLVLSPVVASTDVGYSHVACLLGYLRHGGVKADAFVKTIATVTGFAPLITGLWQITENHVLTGRDVAAVTASLYGFYASLLPAPLPPARVFEYVLRASTFVLHGLITADQDRISLPIMKIAIDARSGDPAQIYLRGANQRTPLLVWKADVDPTISFSRKKQEPPVDQFGIENAFSVLASFRPLAPLSLRTVTGACIAEYTRGHTALFLSESNAKDAASAAKIDLMDPMTGRAASVDLEALAAALGRSESGAMQLIDADKVRQVIQVCFDSSGSMGRTLAGARPSGGEPERITIAAQYLTTFANRTYGYRVPCIQGLISFETEIVTRSELSPLVPAFEDGVRSVAPAGRRTSGTPSKRPRTTSSRSPFPAASTSSKTRRCGFCVYPTVRTTDRPPNPRTHCRRWSPPASSATRSSSRPPTNASGSASYRTSPAACRSARRQSVRAFAFLSRRRSSATIRGGTPRGIAARSRTRRSTAARPRRRSTGPRSPPQRSPPPPGIRSPHPDTSSS